MFEGFEDLLAEITWRFVIFFSREPKFLRIESGKTTLNVELRELRHTRERDKHSGRKEATLPEKPSHRHIAELPTLGHLLHGGLHLLL